MDLIKIGKFIQERRKSKKLTQVQLALQIGVSEKTISKWECGNGFPDATLIMPLCKALDISANELLSGMLLESNEEYKQQAENNLIILNKVQEKNVKFLLLLECVIGFLSVALLLGCVFVASFVALPDIFRIILCVVGIIFASVGIHFCLLIEKDAGFYECGYCHHKYIPTYKQIICSTHIGRTRHMKCPKCNKKSWSKKVIKKD